MINTTAIKSWKNIDLSLGNGYANQYDISRAQMEMNDRKNKKSQNDELSDLLNTMKLEGKKWEIAKVSYDDKYYEHIVESLPEVTVIFWVLTRMGEWLICRRGR